MPLHFPSFPFISLTHSFHLNPTHLLLERMGVDVQCQITHKLQTCSTGPRSHSLCTFIGGDPTATFNQPVSWEEMTSQHQDRPQRHWKQMSTKRVLTPSWTQVRRDCINPWGQTIGPKKQLFEVCLLDTKRLRETLHVKGELLFFSRTLWWAVSSCWQRVLALQPEHVLLLYTAGFTVNVNVNAYLSSLKVRYCAARYTLTTVSIYCF